MKRILWLASALILAVAGCIPAATATPIPAISLDSDASSLNQVKASAVVVPAKEARLSFVISGLVEEVSVEKGDQIEAGQVLASLDTSELEYDLVAAQAALTSAEIDAQFARLRRKKFDTGTFNFKYVSPPGEKIVIADAKVDQMRSGLERVEASIAQTLILSPFTGTVAEVNVSAGEFVQASQPVIYIADLENLLIETTDLSELNVADVEIGQPATVYIEALDEEFAGNVITISPISNTIGGDVVFKVTIQLDDQPGTLLWGMSADVEIHIE